MARQGKVNPLTSTLKPQSNGPLYSNTVIGTQRREDWAGIGSAPTKVYSGLAVTFVTLVTLILF